MARATNAGVVRLFFLAVTAAVGANLDASVGDSDSNTVEPTDPDAGRKISLDEYTAVGGVPLKPSDKEVKARRRVNEIRQEAKEDNARMFNERSGSIKQKGRSKRNTEKVRRILNKGEAALRNSFQSAIKANFVQNSASADSSMVVRTGLNTRGSNSWSTGWDANWGWQDPWYDPWGGSAGWYEGSKSSKIGKGSSWGGDDWLVDGWVVDPWKGDDWLGRSAKSSKASINLSDPWKGDDYHFNDWDKGWGKGNDWGSWGKVNDWGSWGMGNDNRWDNNKDWGNGLGKNNDWDKGRGRGRGWGDNDRGKTNDWGSGWGKNNDWDKGGGTGWGDNGRGWGGGIPLRTAPPTLSPTLSPTFYPTFYPTISPTFSPTSSPTWTPTWTPTLSPTITEPTFSPTYSPTLYPTISPTAAPTDTPTGYPTIAPTITPTSLEPSYSPTMSPTNCPIEDQADCCISGSQPRCMMMGCNLDLCECTAPLLAACCESGLSGTQQGKCLSKLGCDITKCKQTGKF